MDTGKDDPRGREGPLDPAARADLLKRGWGLLASRNYKSLQELLEPLPEEELVREPELGFLFGAALRRRGEKHGALRILEAVLDSAYASSNSRLIRESMNLAGAVLLELGRLAQADGLFQGVLESAIRSGDQFYAATAYHNLGVAAEIRCQHTVALAYFQRALAQFQQLGHLRGIGEVHQNLGMIYRTLGLYAEADSHFEHAFQLFASYGSVDELNAAESERALLNCYRGDVRLAEATALRAYSQALAHGLDRNRGETLRVLGIIASAAGDWPSAEERFRTSLATARATTNPLLEAEVLEELAVLAQTQGEEEEMERLIEESAAIYERIGTPARARRARERVAPATLR